MGIDNIELLVDNKINEFKPGVRPFSELENHGFLYVIDKALPNGMTIELCRDDNGCMAGWRLVNGAKRSEGYDRIIEYVKNFYVWLKLGH